MVRRDEAGREPPPGEGSASRCVFLAGVSPVRVTVGGPGSRPRAVGESLPAQAGRPSPPRRKQVRGPQHQVKPAASTQKQSGCRAVHASAKAISPALAPKRAGGPGGVRGAARGHRETRNTRGPSAWPLSGQGAAYKPMAKSHAGQRESEGVVVPSIIATNNAMGGKGPCFGRARQAGRCQGMDGQTVPNSPGPRKQPNHAPQPRSELGSRAKRGQRRRRDVLEPLRSDVRGVTSSCRSVGDAQARSRRPSASRVREIRTHGLNGGLANSPTLWVGNK